MLARVLMAFLAVLLVGCGKPGAGSAATGAPDQAQIDAGLNELTQAVRKYAAEQRRAPKALDELVANSEEHANLVQQLETAADAESERPFGSIPSGDELAAELERFLREENQ